VSGNTSDAAGPSGSDPRLTKRVAAVPPLYRAAYVKAVSGNLSPRQAIKAKCLDCCGWQREEVRHCTVRGCPLWPLRPFQTSRGGPFLAGKPSPSGDFSEEVASLDPKAACGVEGSQNRPTGPASETPPNQLGGSKTLA
jgi:hypothetical protein